MTRIRGYRLVLLGVFALSRLIYFAAGIRFDARPLDTFFQIFDPVLLEDRLFQTLLYAHTQPPGFNLLIGCVLKLFPVDYSIAFHVLYLALGVVILLSLFELMRAMGVSETVAAIVTTLFIISPAIILFENLLMYEYPLLALLCVAALCWNRLFRTPRALTAFCLFSIVATLVAFRSIFHLFYFVLAIAVVVYAFRGYRWKLLAAAALPFLVAFGIYLKNWVLYGQFTSSTWMGFNIFTITTRQLTTEELNRFIAQGKLSPVERIITLGPVADYAGFIAPAPPRGIPILDQQRDSTGRVNFNNLAFFQLHRLYLQDGKFLLKHYPIAYLRSVAIALFAYFRPASDFVGVEENREHIRSFERWFNKLAFGQFKQKANYELRSMEAEGAGLWLVLYTGTFLIIAFPALFVFGCTRLWLGIRTSSWTAPRNALLAFMLFHIAMVTTLVNLLSSFENNRYRLPIDGFFAILAALAIDSVVKAIREKKRRPAASHPLAQEAHAN